HTRFSRDWSSDVCSSDLELVPRQREILVEHVRREFDEMSGVAGAVLAARRRNLVEQLFELNALRGKNRDVMGHMAARIRSERERSEERRVGEECTARRVA